MIYVKEIALKWREQREEETHGGARAAGDSRIRGVDSAESQGGSARWYRFSSSYALNFKLSSCGKLPRSWNKEHCPLEQPCAGVQGEFLVLAPSWAGLGEPETPGLCAAGPGEVLLGWEPALRRARGPRSELWGCGVPASPLQCSAGHRALGITGAAAPCPSGGIF